MALIDPKQGKFNVTAKGGLVQKNFLDWKIGSPYLIMLMLNMVGLLIGIGRLIWWNTFETGTVALNLMWTLYNLTFLGATIAVATESKQVRVNHRVDYKQRATLKFANGGTVICQSKDYSEGGLGLQMPAADMVPLHSQVQISLYVGEMEYVFPARVITTRDTFVGIEFDNLDLRQQMNLVQCTLARADAWLDWDEHRVVDHPLHALKEIFFHSMKGYQYLWFFMRKGLGEKLAGDVAEIKA